MAVKLLDRFNNLPTPAKIGLTVGVGLLLYFLVVRKTSLTAAADSSGSSSDSVYEFPSESSDTVASGSSSVDTSGFVTQDDLANIVEGFNDSYANLETLVGQSASSSVNVLDNPIKINSGKEGNNAYKVVEYADGSKEVYKNNQLVPEENYKYIPQKFGGTRKTGSGLGDGSSSSKTSSGSKSNSSSSKPDSGSGSNQHAYLTNMANGKTETGAKANDGQVKWAKEQLAKGKY